MKQNGRSKHPLYWRWRSMLARCKYPSHTSWKWYGALGIKVSKRWSVFENFISDMGPMPSKTSTIERINNKGNYSPGNCFWASPKEQASNKSNSMRMEFDGVSNTAPKWARITGISAEQLGNRRRKGWSDHRALTEPIKRAFMIELDGVSKTREEWEGSTGIKAATIWWRIKNGWSVRDALTTPLHAKYHNKNNFEKKD